jgi:hypothetical protein
MRPLSLSSAARASLLLGASIATLLAACSPDPAAPASALRDDSANPT